MLSNISTLLVKTGFKRKAKRKVGAYCFAFKEALTNEADTVFPLTSAPGTY